MSKKVELKKEDILSCTEKNMLIKDIAKQLNCSIDVLKFRMKEFGIKYKPSSWRKGKTLNELREHPEIDKQWLIDNWVNTSKSLKTLAKELGVNDSLLEYRVSFYKLKKNRKYKIDLEKLFNLGDPEIWYLAGLIATDGYLRSNSDVIEIGLVGEDELKLLNRINDYLKSDYPIRYNVGANSHTIVLSAIGIKNFFSSNFNIPLYHKTYYLQVPKLYINENCIKAYILGSLDGDGYISANVKCASIRLVTSSEDYIDGMINLIKTYFGESPNKYLITRNNNTYFGFEISGRNKCYRFLKWLLSYNPKLFLKRKYDRCQQIIDSVEQKKGGDVYEEVNKN